MNSLLSNNLLKRYQSNTLGNFYILRATSNSKELLTSFLDNYFWKILNTTGEDQGLESAQKRIENGHPDFLIIKKSSEQNSYLEDDNLPGEIGRFTLHRPMFLSRKFVVIHDAHQIPDRILNKLLKTLEDPGIFTSIFFCMPSATTLLKTIESRSITLRLIDQRNSYPVSSKSFLEYCQSNIENSSLLNKLSNYFQKKVELQELLQSIKNNQMEETILTNYVNFQKEHLTNFEECQKTINKLQSFEESKLFSNSQEMRLLSLINAIS